MTARVAFAVRCLTCGTTSHAENAQARSWFRSRHRRECPDAVYRRVPRERPTRDAAARAIVALAQAGWKDAAIARELRINKATVKRVTRAAGLGSGVDDS